MPMKSITKYESHLIFHPAALLLTESMNSWHFKSSFRIVIASTWKKLLTRIIVFVFVCCPGIDTKYPADSIMTFRSSVPTGRVQSLFITLHALACISWRRNMMMWTDKRRMVQSSDWMFHGDFLEKKTECRMEMSSVGRSLYHAIDANGRCKVTLHLSNNHSIGKDDLSIGLQCVEGGNHVRKECLRTIMNSAHEKTKFCF